MYGAAKIAPLGGATRHRKSTLRDYFRGALGVVEDACVWWLIRACSGLGSADKKPACLAGIVTAARWHVVEWQGVPKTFVIVLTRARECQLAPTVELCAWLWHSCGTDAAERSVALTEALLSPAWLAVDEWRDFIRGCCRCRHRSSHMTCCLHKRGMSLLLSGVCERSVNWLGWTFPDWDSEELGYGEGRVCG